MFSRDETRQRILDATADMVDRFGPVKTSIADVARELGMSPANIYNFFPSKEALLETLGECHFADLRSALRARLAEAPDPWSAICILFMDISHAIRARIGNEKDVIQLQVMANRQCWSFIRNFHAFVLVALEQQIVLLMRDRNICGIDAHESAAALFDCLIRAVDPMLILNTPRDEHDCRLHAQLALLERAFTTVHGPCL